ncbi:argininosuccinate lyase [Haloglomus litoreum]|uniref:argininosuccinate lyase n=1 Tax=Haloglomus litoreum TaxID=3034026 RepID=UPI0023E7FC41|nr:argininosuccinate lyase [Haloglomus sp. DT116]
MTGREHEATDAGAPPNGGTDEVATDGSGESDSAGDGDVVRRERFSGGPAREFLSSLAQDERIFAADLAVDRAHTVMLAEQGIIGDDEAGEILGALDDVEAAGHAALDGGEDVHAAIETAVIERIGPVGGKMHTARSRNDEVATCIRYRLRADLLDTVDAVLAARDVLLGTMAAERETLAPGYTHLQPAQPTTVAHWLGSYEGALARDTGRLFDAFDRTNRSPLGGAAFGGTPFDIDRERTAALLGFDGLVENSMDASSARDFLLEATSALATLATHCSGLAEDLVLFANRGFVELDDDYASTSSIMPQKKNPDTLELVRAVAGDAAGDLQAVLTSLKGLPRAYNRDLQRVHPHAFDAADAVLDAVEVTAGAVATADWNEAALAEAADEGFSTATGVADLLAMAGVPFRTAHELVARAAEAGDDRSALRADERYEAVTAAAEDVLDAPLAEYVDPEEVRRALDPVESVAMRDSRGGPAPEAMAAHHERATDARSADQEALAARREGLTEAADRLATEVDRHV